MGDVGAKTPIVDVGVIGVAVTDQGAALEFDVGRSGERLRAGVLTATVWRSSRQVEERDEGGRHR